MTLGTMNDVADPGDLIRLEPLVHQVGGHSSMFVLDDVIVCKPLIGQELKFYRTMPPEMKKYIPEYKGTLQVVVQEDGKGLSMRALPNEQTISLRNTRGAFKHGKLRRVSSSSMDYDTSSDEDELSPHHPSSSTAHFSSSRISVGNEGEPKNPWLEQCQQSHLHRLKESSNSSDVVECIMLENLTFKLRCPCILDLKMGTRQYGDDAPEAKRRSQSAKASKTTTVSLGVRLAGMQVYNREKECYICKNKYFGRQLSEESFKQTLKQFLHNGKRIQYDVLEVIRAKLKELRSIIAKLDSFRFFTSSLLIIYDSCDSYSKRADREFNRDREKDFYRDSDFNSRHQDILTEKDYHRESHEREFRAKDLNVENGKPLRRNSKDLTTEIRDGFRLPSPVSGPPIDISQTVKSEAAAVSYKLKSNNGKTSLENLTKSEQTPYKMKSRHKRTRKPKVDIRLIDFAHATHKGMGDKICYNGADDGILYGLDKLINIFMEIRENYERC